MRRLQPVTEVETVLVVGYDGVTVQPATVRQKTDRRMLRTDISVQQEAAMT